MRRTGAPEVLAIEEVEAPFLQAGEVRIRALRSAVNHSDLEIRAGNWAVRRYPQFPYVPGLEVVGDVVEVASGVPLAEAARAHSLIESREVKGRVVLIPGERPT